MNNIFSTYNPETSNENIQSIGAAGVYKPGIYIATGAEIVLFETEWEGVTRTNANIIITTDSGATLVDELRVAPKSNQTDATTDLLNYLHNIAVVTDKLDALAQLKTQFATLPKVKYTDKFKKEHTALSIKLFANAKFKFMTYSEVSGSANGIFTSQRVTLNQLFRFLDNASLGEIKDNKEEVGGSFAYWTEDEIKCAAKAQVQYSTKRDERDTAVLEVIVDHLKEAKPFTKEQREKIQDHFDADYAKSVLAGATTSAAVDTSSVDVEEDDSETPSFG